MLAPSVGLVDSVWQAGAAWGVEEAVEWQLAGAPAAAAAAVAVVKELGCAAALIACVAPRAPSCLAP